MTLGNMRVVSEMSGFSYDTLTAWKKEEWWQPLVEELRNARNAQKGAKLENIIEESLEVVADRLKNGEVIFNSKTGELVRKPVSLRDASTVTNQLLTRQLQLEELGHKLDGDKTTVKETLTMLAKEFSKWNRIQNGKATDAIYEERETGLQAGSSSLYLETGSEKETC